MAFPTIMGKIIDRTVSKGETKTNKIPDKVFFAGAFGIFAFGSIGSLVRTYCIGVASHNIARKIREKLFDALLQQEISFFDEQRTGELVSLISEDAKIAADTCTGKLANGIRSASSAINGTVMLFTISPKLTLVSIAILPFVGMGAMAYSKKLKRIANLQRENEADLSSFAEERFMQIKTVRGFGKEKEEVNRYKIMLEGSSDLAKKAAFSRGIFMGGLSASANTSLFAVLFVGGSLVSKGEMTVGNLTSFAIYSSLVALGFSGLSSFASELTKGLASAERVFKYIDRIPAIHLDDGIKVPKREVRGEIILDDVWFKYPNREKDVLKGVNLRILKGQILAITGPSGHGKTTLKDLLSHLYEPNKGSILLDGIELGKYSSSWLHEMVGIVEQDSPLFSGTIRENIAYALPDAKIEDVISAATAANAHQFIVDFPEGYETVAGQGGKLLSGGQKQRIAIARALLKRPPILILDEATSALDSESERLVREAIENLITEGGRTLIIIAHRQSTIMKANAIAVIKDGMVAEIGTYDELYKKGGIFYEQISAAEC